MGIKEFSQVTPTNEVIGTIGGRLRNGSMDPICFMAKGTPPAEEADSMFFVAMPGERYKNRLGTLELDDVNGNPHMGLKAEAELLNNPGLLGPIVQLAMAAANVESVTIQPEVDTNVSEEVLRGAGAVAINGNIFEFHSVATA